MAVHPGSSQALSYVPIKACVAGPGVSLETGASSIYPGCHCSPVCAGACSCTMVYRQTGTVKEEYLSDAAPPIFECNSRCFCSENCPNRVSQQGLRPHLRVDKTELKGLGVYTGEDIPRGGFVGEYVGEVISNAHAQERLKSLDEHDSCYVLTFKEHLPNASVLATNIDATTRGNVIRFVNHSCSPNMVMLPIRTDSILPRLCLFACRDISAGEELCFSYFGRPGAEVASAPAGELKLGRKACLCRSQDCVGFLPLEQ